MSQSYFREVLFSNQANKLSEVTCRFCGAPIIDCPTDANGSAVNPRMEREQRAHSSCMRLYIAKNPVKAEPAVNQDPISDDLMAKYARQTDSQQG
jgi:hypothetical protein